MAKKTTDTEDTKKEQTAAELVESGVCPECGVSLEGIDPVAHAGKEWRGQGDAAPKEGTKAYERQQALLGKDS